MDDCHSLEAASLIVDVCARVWDDGVMPPCIRDPRNGKKGSAVCLMFNPKTIYTGGRGGVGNPTDVVDHILLGGKGPTGGLSLSGNRLSTDGDRTITDLRACYTCT